ncbi:hypothetical protein NLJ89_g9280 [Agrocybe chaxingu]|uniref:Uncharacterized protein n=1 Tax=Agrocybe chaxingu TaxID=84603 RepID=A0A9W8MRD5_9AGAR|nr:hypothetical protein NLJ89_g9280 [Agrocybe chaxingu]
MLLRGFEQILPSSNTKRPTLHRPSSLSSKPSVLELCIIQGLIHQSTMNFPAARTSFAERVEVYTRSCSLGFYLADWKKATEIALKLAIVDNPPFTPKIEINCTHDASFRTPGTGMLSQCELEQLQTPSCR